MSICQEEYRRPSSIASYVSTPEQHLAAQVQVYPKGRKIPPDVENGERRGFIICTSKVYLIFFEFFDFSFQFDSTRVPAQMRHRIDSLLISGKRCDGKLHNSEGRAHN